LSSECADVIGELLKVNSALEELNLKNNYLGEKGAISIRKTLSVNKCLIKLNLKDNQ